MGNIVSIDKRRNTVSILGVHSFLTDNNYRNSIIYIPVELKKMTRNEFVDISLKKMKYKVYRKEFCPGCLAD